MWRGLTTKWWHSAYHTHVIPLPYNHLPIIEATEACIAVSENFLLTEDRDVSFGGRGVGIFEKYIYSKLYSITLIENTLSDKIL